MSLTKKLMVKKIQGILKVNHSLAEQYFNQLLSALKEALLNEDEIILQGIGRIKVRTKKARKARNPSNGETVYLPARRGVVMAITDEFKAELNEKPQEEKSPGL